MGADETIIKKHSAGGVVIEGDKVLALSWTDKDFICFPKGGLKASESSEEAAVRELKEETGYNTRIVAPLGSWSYSFQENGRQYHKVVDYFLMELADDDEPVPSREEAEFFENTWLEIDTAKTRLTYSDAKEALDYSIKLLH